MRPQFFALCSSLKLAISLCCPKPAELDAAQKGSWNLNDFLKGCMEELPEHKAK